MKKLVPFLAVLLLWPAGTAAGGTSAPWPEAYIDHLPPSLRQMARDHVRSEAEMLDEIAQRLSTAKDPGDFLSGVAIRKTLSSRAGVLALLDVLGSAPEPAVRLKIADRFGSFGFRFGLTDTSAEGQTPPIEDVSSLAVEVGRALETAMVNAGGPTEAALMADHFVRFQQRRLVSPIIEAAKVARQHGDLAGADLLRVKLQHLWLPGVLPDFFYRRFVSLEVPVPVGEPVRVLAFGDFGTGSPSQIATAAAMRREHDRRPFHLGLTVGDNFYPEGLDDPDHPRWRTQWEDLYGPMSIPFYATLGNHDYLARGSALAQIMYSDQSASWEMPAPNYSFRAGPAEFFALDTNVLRDDQLQWLEAGLKSSAATWKIVYGHHPIYSSGVVSDREPLDLTGRLLPILRQQGVHAYLNGHNHAMEEWTPQGGVHLFTVGSGGAGIYDHEEAPDSVFRSEAHGFGVLEITDETLTVQFVDVDGQVIHERMISAD